MSSRALRVEATGPRVLVQDLGRPGLAHLGIGVSGAADPASLRLANRLVGNPEGAAALELLLGGLVARAVGDLVVAITGPADAVTVAGRGAHLDGPLGVSDGAAVTVATGATGLRSYLAVRGGVAVPPVLGSRATDTLSGLGPAAVAAGDELAVGEPSGPWPTVDLAPRRERIGGPGAAVVGVVAGPRDDWFAPGAVELLTSGAWSMSADTDRVGHRLDGPELPRAAGRHGELASAGLVRGAIQVPPHGRPVVMGPDHPVTGGYPVIGVVVSGDVGRLAQVRPGGAVRFRLVR